MRKVSVLAALVTIVTALTISPAAPAQNNSKQIGLVNVSLGDVNLLNNVNLAVAANVAATVCGFNVPVALLAQQVVVDDDSTICATNAGPLDIEQAQPGEPRLYPPNAGGNNSQQAGLINLSIGDVNILNNVNLAVAANVAATVCGVNVPVAVLAVQTAIITGDTVCQTNAGPTGIDQFLSAVPAA